EGLDEAPPARRARPQAPVDVLVIGEVRLVEEPDLAQGLGPQQQAASGDGADLEPAVEAFRGEAVHAPQLDRETLVQMDVEIRHVEQLGPVEAEDAAAHAPPAPTPP